MKLSTWNWFISSYECTIICCPLHVKCITTGSPCAFSNFIPPIQNISLFFFDTEFLKNFLLICSSPNKLIWMLFWHKFVMWYTYFYYYYCGVNSEKAFLHTNQTQTLRIWCYSQSQLSEEFDSLETCTNKFVQFRHYSIVVQRWKLGFQISRSGVQIPIGKKILTIILPQFGFF